MQRDRNESSRLLLVFFLLTYLVSWVCFLASANASPSTPGQQVSAGPFYLLGVFAPALVALALTAANVGRPGVLALLRRISPSGVGAGWYAFAIVLMPAIKLCVALAYRTFNSGWPRFGPEPWYVIAAAIVISTPFQAGEEVGWRGFALPRFASRVGLGRASLLLGVLWAAWHLPFFFIPGLDKSGQSFPVYLLQITALSVIMAWLYWRTSGNLLITMLMHSAVNQSIGIVPSTVPGASRPFALSTSLVGWLTLALLWAVAAFCLMQMRGRRLEPSPALRFD